MLPEVHKDIDQRVSDFTWRFQHARVEPVRPDAAVPSEGPVHRLRQSNGKTPHAARERRHGVCFNEKMDVIRLHAEMNDAEIALGRGRQSTAHPGEYVAGTQRPQAGDRT